MWVIPMPLASEERHAGRSLQLLCPFPKNQVAKTAPKQFASGRFPSDHLTDIAHIGIQGPAEDGQDQLKHLIHDVILLSVRWRRVLF